MRGNRGVRLIESDPARAACPATVPHFLQQPASDLVVRAAGRTNVEASRMGGLIFAFARQIYGCCA
jgi:hypothetical protein